MRKTKTQRLLNEGTMTEAEFRSMIISALRNASRWWKGKTACIKRAKRGYNRYQCELCGEIGPASLPALPGKKRKRKNIQADHIQPVVDPLVGFTTYDDWISRCFVPSDGFQAICWKCHEGKTKEENLLRKAGLKNKNK